MPPGMCSCIKGSVQSLSSGAVVRLGRSAPACRRTPVAVKTRCDLENAMLGPMAPTIASVVIADTAQGVGPNIPLFTMAPASASVSRVFIGLAPARNAARYISRIARPTGPLSVLVVLLTLIGALFAAIRQYVAYNVKHCTNCRGFGIQRCVLCGGDGQVGWEGKFSHLEPCPRCLGRRYVNCRECGGFFHRPIFDHRTLDPSNSGKMKRGSGSEPVYNPGFTATLTTLYD